MDAHYSDQLSNADTNSCGYADTHSFSDGNAEPASNPNCRADSYSDPDAYADADTFAVTTAVNLRSAKYAGSRL